MQPKVAILKPLSSAISIGTGGPFGAEGPIIMTGGAFGSMFAQLFHLTAAERKTLLVAGAAAGMSAIFATPVAAVLLAVELLLFEWKPRSFIPVAVAVDRRLGGARALDWAPARFFPSLPHAPSFGRRTWRCAAVVGILAGLWLRTADDVWFMPSRICFQKLPIHWMWWPAIGGISSASAASSIRARWASATTPSMACCAATSSGPVVARVAGDQSARSGRISLGSGTSGGVLAPLLMMGGALGALGGIWLPVGDPGFWAMIGMAAMMAAPCARRSPPWSSPSN